MTGRAVQRSRPTYLPRSGLLLPPPPSFLPLRAWAAAKYVGPSLSLREKLGASRYSATPHTHRSLARRALKKNAAPGTDRCRALSAAGGQASAPRGPASRTHARKNEARGAEVKNPDLQITLKATKVIRKLPIISTTRCIRVFYLQKELLCLRSELRSAIWVP